MKAKERERRRGDRYVLEKDTHKHTRRGGDGESPSPGGPTLDKVATSLGSLNFPKSETSQMGAEGNYRMILDPKQYRESNHTEKKKIKKKIKTSSNSGQ